MTLITQEQITEKIHSEVKSLLGSLKMIPSGWMKQNCKLCHHRGHKHDKRERFGLKIDGDGLIVANCFNCKFGASWRPGRTLSKPFKWFLTHIGMSLYDVKRLDFELYKFRNDMESSNSLKLREDVTKTWEEKELPKGSKTIGEWAAEGCTDKNFIQVIEYLNDRKLLYPDDIYWTPSDPMYRKRANLPFYYDGKIVGWSARYAGEPKNKANPKYMSDTPKSFLYNLDAQKDDNRKYVILTEGTFDGFITNGVAALGSELNEDQISILNKLGKEIIVVPDKDDAGQSLFNIAVKEGFSVSTPKWGKGIKDAAKAVETYGRLLTIQTIIEARDTSAFAAKLKRQMDKS